MSDSDQAHALLVHAALEETRARGVQNLPVALAEVPEPTQRVYLYAVSDEHPLVKEYGSSSLSAILLATKTPYLVDQKGPKKGVRYAHKDAELAQELIPFTTDDARRAWRAEAVVRRSEQKVVADIALSLTGLSQIDAERKLPAPRDEQDLATPAAGSISPNKPTPAGRGASDSR